MDDKGGDPEHGLGLSWGGRVRRVRTATLSSWKPVSWKPGPWDGPGGNGLAQGPSIRDNTGPAPLIVEVGGGDRFRSSG